MRTGCPRAFLVSAIGCLCLALGACGAGPEVSPPTRGGSTPVGPGSAESAAVGHTAVGGESTPAPSLVRVGGIDVSRESIIRSIGRRDPEETEAHYEERIHARVIRETLKLVHAQAAAHGIPGPVPQQDPTFEEALRLYARHTRAFDEGPAVKCSVFTMNVENAPGEVPGTFEAAVLRAHRRMDALLSDHAHGEPASDVATRYGLLKQDWVAPDDWVEYPSQKIGAPREGSTEEWAFSSDRRPGERKVFEPGHGEVVGIAIHAVRESRARPFEAVRENVVDQIRWVRTERRRLAQQLVLLSSASIHPASHSEELQAQTREELRGIDENPVWRDIEAN